MTDVPVASADCVSVPSFWKTELLPSPEIRALVRKVKLAPASLSKMAPS